MAEVNVVGTGAVVVVDDDPMFQEILHFMFAESGLQNSFLSIRSGEECLEFLSHGKELPALILMDVHMPGLSGFETIEKIRDIEAYLDVPILVMLSSDFEESQKERALSSGASGYFEKPFDITTLRFLSA